MPEELKPVTFRIPVALAARLKSIARTQERSIQAILARAVTLGLDTIEARESIAAQAIAKAEQRRQQQPPEATPDA